MHYFTPDEANAALERVRPLAEQMVERRRAMLAAQAREEELGARVAGNGGGIDPGEPARTEAVVEDEARAIAQLVDEIHALGAQVKDIDTGLLDFPSLREGEEVLLCWRVGEDDIRYWHTLDGGFAGRQPL
ncbi:MAG: DUF2203 family protein [Actinobacteria bacterium]|nr:MAG: DUF2203 family protein [Actinomycetota bacterium]